MTDIAIDDRLQFLLRLADSPLVLSHRLSEWAGHGPVLEEDIALANIALDLLGQARLLYQHAATVANRNGTGRNAHHLGAGHGLDKSDGDLTEDSLAYFRDDAQFRNFTMLELPNSGVSSASGGDGDYAFTIVRNTLYSAWSVLLWQALAASTDPQVAAIAAKSVKESRYHWRHASDWLVRLGDGTDESHQRCQRALDSLLPYSNEWFLADALDLAAASAGLGIDPSTLLAPWLAMVQSLVEQATLKWPGDSRFHSAGKRGQHGEHLSYLLTQMQSLARAHPGAVW